MAARKSFLVIGLGRFGASVSTALVEAGHDVLGVDVDPAVVQRMSSKLTHAVVLDATNEEGLASLGVGNFDAVVVSAAGHFEASVLITLLLKQRGARFVVAKAPTEQQADVLDRVGADEVVQPERDAGRRLARRLIAPNVIDYLTMQPGLSVAEVTAPDFMVGKTLGELDVRRRYNIAVLLIRNGPRLVISPDPDDHIIAGDTLVLVGPDEQIERLRG